MAPFSDNWVGSVVEGVDVVANVVLAIVAVFGSRLRNWWVRPVLTLVCTSQIYKEEEQEEAQQDNEFGIESPKRYYIDVKNKGRGLARDVTVECITILRKESDGDTVSVVSKGHIAQFIWRTDTEKRDVLGNSAEMLKFIRFDADKQYANDDIEGKKRNKKMVCALWANRIGCRESIGVILSKEGVFTRLIQLSVRAANLNKAATFWVSVHWDPSEEKDKVSSKTFKVRLATKAEEEAANEALMKEDKV